jgi:cellulose synthase/poly-beta-1,6-N-acetylglucosamine synthase-like glycosyltransferase
MASPSSSAVSAHNCFAQAGPKISVIVPVYNMAAWLPRCLDSLLCQSYRNLEILLVNDGSTDDSARVMQAYAARDARIRCVTLAVCFRHASPAWSRPLGSTLPLWTVTTG